MSATNKSPQSRIKATMWWNTFKQHASVGTLSYAETTHTALGDSTGVRLLPSKIRQQLGHIILLNWQCTALLRTINLTFDQVKKKKEAFFHRQCISILLCSDPSGDVRCHSGVKQLLHKATTCLCVMWTHRALLALTMLFTYFPKHAPLWSLCEGGKFEMHKGRKSTKTLGFLTFREFPLDWYHRSTAALHPGRPCTQIYIIWFLWNRLAVLLLCECTSVMRETRYKLLANKWRCRSEAMFLNQCEESVTAMEINTEGGKNWDSTSYLEDWREEASSVSSFLRVPFVLLPPSGHSGPNLNQDTHYMYRCALLSRVFDILGKKTLLFWNLDVKKIFFGFLFCYYLLLMLQETFYYDKKKWQVSNVGVHHTTFSIEHIHHRPLREIPFI